MVEPDSLHMYILATNSTCSYEHAISQGKSAIFITPVHTVIVYLMIERAEIKGARKVVSICKRFQKCIHYQHENRTSSANHDQGAHS